jgi:hypothetical protein
MARIVKLAGSDADGHSVTFSGNRTRTSSFRGEKMMSPAPISTEAGPDVLPNPVPAPDPEPPKPDPTPEPSPAPPVPEPAPAFLATC